MDIKKIINDANTAFSDDESFSSVVCSTITLYIYMMVALPVIGQDVQASQICLVAVITVAMLLLKILIYDVCIKKHQMPRLRLKRFFAMYMLALLSIIIFPITITAGNLMQAAGASDKAASLDMIEMRSIYALMLVFVFYHAGDEWIIYESNKDESKEKEVEETSK